MGFIQASTFRHFNLLQHWLDTNKAFLSRSAARMPTVINNGLTVLAKLWVVQYVNSVFRNGLHRALVGSLVMVVPVESKEAQWVTTPLSQQCGLATLSPQNTE